MDQFKSCDVKPERYTNRNFHRLHWHMDTAGSLTWCFETDLKSRPWCTPEEYGSSRTQDQLSPYMNRTFHSYVYRRVLPKGTSQQRQMQQQKSLWSHCVVRLLVGHDIVNCGLQRLNWFVDLQESLVRAVFQERLLSQFLVKAPSWLIISLCKRCVITSVFDVCMCMPWYMKMLVENILEYESAQCRLVKICQKWSCLFSIPTACHAKFRSFQQVFAFMKHWLY